jgi:fructokinase
MIVVAGEALVDLTVFGDGTVAVAPGGGPFNAARAVARLDVPAAFIGRLSSDRLGARLRAALDADGVSLAGVVQTPDPTTLAIAEVDQDGTAGYHFYLDGTSAPGLTPEAALAGLAAVGDQPAALHIGTLGLQVEPCASAVRALAERLAGRSLVFVDPNCRPAATPDAGEVRERVRAALAAADVVKASDEDLAFLFPREPAASAAVILRSYGARVALVTHGAAGATIVTDAGAARVPGRPVAVIDTIGAGDTFGGAFLAWWVGSGRGAADLADGEALIEATRFAVAAAAVTCSRRGADPPFLIDLS